MFHLPFRKIFYGASAVSLAGIAVATYYWPPAAYSLIVVMPAVVIGLGDIFQHKHAIKKNFPIIGHGRYLLESIRPEIHQYFIETDTDGMPFDRVTRANIYQRAKNVTDTVPFGTKEDVYRVGYEWINHSMAPKHPVTDDPRVLVGTKDCKQPYSASIFNISAMSFGSLSNRAVLALNEGANLGGFYHNTGEGGISKYHLKPGGDLVWQIGTGYFGCRTAKGKFDPGLYEEKSRYDSVKMIELKLSQGAKPGHGGILPASKITPEIAEIRHVEMGEDVLSPPGHSTFNSPIGLMEFIAQLRELSGGKPVGFKLCVGSREEFFGICKAMLETGILPDFITVDGAEGGTGAAPLEFCDSIGVPANDGLIFVHNALTGIGVRDQVRLIVAGKVTTGFHIASKLAIGADICNSARGMMFALGCIQALQCNTNTCPTGVATQDPYLVAGLDVLDKSRRVYNFHKAIIHNFLDLLGAAGLTEPSELKPHHILRRVSSTEIKHLEEIYPFIPSGSLLDEPYPDLFDRPWREASAGGFQFLASRLNP